MHNAFRKLCQFGTNRNVGLLILRLAVGLFLLLNGLNMLQHMPDVIANYSESFGIGSFWVWAMAISEFVAGLMIILGVLEWVSALLVVAYMLFTLFVIILPYTEGYPFIQRYLQGMGLAVTYTAAVLALAFVGSGKWSVTSLWKRYRKQCECEVSPLCDACRCAPETPAAPAQPAA